jgi:hypothetical protein
MHIFTPRVSHQLSVRARSEPEAAGHAALFFHGLMHDSDLSNGRLAQRLTDWGVRASIDRDRPTATRHAGALGGALK